MSELWNLASLRTELGAGPKTRGNSVHLHEKGSVCLWNFNTDLDITYRLDSHRATAGTHFTSLVLMVSFLLLDSVSASEPFPLSSH